MIRDGQMALREFAKSDTRDHSYEELEASMANLSVGAILKDMQPIMKNELKMTAEAVNVRYSRSAKTYFVELNQLVDLMQAANVRNFQEALDLVARANSSDKVHFEGADIAVLIDEKGCEECINDCKECGGTNASQKYKDAKTEAVKILSVALENMKNSGVKMVLNPAR